VSSLRVFHENVFRLCLSRLPGATAGVDVGLGAVWEKASTGGEGGREAVSAASVFLVLLPFIFHLFKPTHAHKRGTSGLDAAAREERQLPRHKGSFAHGGVTANTWALSSTLASALKGA
jgi:hypothetical protein